MTRPRSLADELAELVNPAPQAELDPEAAGIADGDQLGGSDDELAGFVAGAATARRAITADIALTGGQYAGRRTSRAAIFGDENGADENSSSGDEGEGEAGNADDGDQPAADGIRYAQHEHGPLPPGRRDLSTIPTMFVNGHMNGPGPDDPTSSSSSMLSGDASDSSDEAHQQSSPEEQADRRQQQTLPAPDTTGNIQQLQRGHDAPAANHANGSSMKNEGESDDESNDGAEEQPQSSRSDYSEEHTDNEQQQEHDTLDAAAAAADVTAMLGDDEEMQQLEREAAAVHAEAAQQLVAASARSSKDAEKAAGVRAQQRLWGAALELRIRLQKAVTGANVLPRSEPRSTLVANNQQVAQRYTELISACQQTLQDMLQLHQSLAQQHPAAAAALAASDSALQQHGKGKRSRAAAGLETVDTAAEAADGDPLCSYVGTCSTASEAWASVDGVIASLAGFRDTSLDKWHRRTVLSSGTAALRGSSGLRALQQSVSSQVAALMADNTKLISRSQLPAELAPRPLGQPATTTTEAEADSDDEEAGAADRGGAPVRRRDPETYDEGDFYQQLLKELIDSAPPGSLPQHLAGARPPKRRKIVDRRASKGRKIRYHTLDKLVGFMAPAELVQPPFAEQLFGNLFNHEG